MATACATEIAMQIQTGPVTAHARADEELELQLR